MNKETQIVFAAFIVSLPGCYLTAFPAVLTCLLFMGLYAESKLLKPLSSKELGVMRKELAELKSQVAALGIRSGLKF